MNETEMLREVAKEIALGDTLYAVGHDVVRVLLDIDLCKRIAKLFPEETGFMGKLLRGAN